VRKQTASVVANLRPIHARGPGKYELGGGAGDERMEHRPMLNALKASDASLELPYHRDGRYSLGESKYRGLYSAQHF